MSVLPVIMAGGSGTRLWPLSRSLYPKQFLALTGEESLLQQTIGRLHGLDAAAPLLICNEEHRFLAAEQLRQIGVNDATILLEPVGRNTAPAIALAALQATVSGDDPLLLVLAADHAIQDSAAFVEAVESGTQLAAQDWLVTFGITPDRPETGYGYVQRGDSLGSGYRVARFVEKPDADTAAAYVASGDYYWNSGMFLFRASHYLAALATLAPEMLAACRRAHEGAQPDLDFLRIDAEAFAASPADSIDYAVMEKTTDAAVVPMQAGWSDIGSWQALWEAGQGDGQGNVVHGDVCVEDIENCFIDSRHGLVTALGLRDIVVVNTSDALLIAPRERVQEVKGLVERLRAECPEVTESHPSVHRPWGHFESIDRGPRYQVKRITVKPGARLSLQMHHHRAEHWVVVSGRAQVVRGEETLLLEENESTFIPLGMKHSLENPGDELLELIEVQSGDYLGEDDIVRFEDRYGRS